MDVFKHPMCLISTETVKDAKGEIININYNGEQEVLNQIKQIDLPMVIVAVVGLYPTDKSYLMSQFTESTKGEIICLIIFEGILHTRILLSCI
jgi:flavodoxin